MANAKDRPFTPGQFPMLKVQWDSMIDVLVQLCRFYAISVSPLTVLGHGEVEKNLGIQQAGKWDPMKLPFEPGLSMADVGKRLRSEVAAKLP